MLNIILFSSSVVSIVSVVALAYGYRASLFSHDKATKYFAWSMVLLASTIFLRRFSWDIMHPVVVKGQIDQRPLNVFYNIIAFFGSYMGLYARLYLIPENERHKWNWYSAWIHPSFWKMRRDRPIREDEERTNQ